MNIACAVPDCKNPVAGQCQGWRESCGRFYCLEHSDDGLCPVHLQIRSEERIYQDYSQTAKRIDDEKKSKKLMPIILSSLVVTGTCCLVFTLISALVSLTFSNQEGAQLPGSIVGVIAVLSLIIIGVGSVIAGWLFIRSINVQKDHEAKRVRQLKKSKPGFAEFYEDWKRKKSREELALGLGIASAVVLGALAGAASGILQTDEESRMRRVVDHELRRHGM